MFLSYKPFSLPENKTIYFCDFIASLIPFTTSIAKCKVCPSATAFGAFFGHQKVDFCIKPFSVGASSWIVSSPDVRTVMKELMPELYEKRRVLLALWRIETRRHRLFHEMQELLRNAFMTQAERKFPDKTKNWDFQATLFATCILTTLRFYFEQNILPPVEQVQADWREMFEIMGI